MEAQQARIYDAPDRKFVGIASDGTVNQTRRLLKAMHDSEIGLFFEAVPAYDERQILAVACFACERRIGQRV